MATQSRTVAQALAEGTYVLPRQTWGSVDPRPRIVAPKKGKGSYQRRAKHPAHEDRPLAGSPFVFHCLHNRLFALFADPSPFNP